MKKFRILSLTLLIFSALSLVSCDTEPVDPVLNDNENNGENPNNPNSPSGGVFKVDFEEKPLLHNLRQLNMKMVCLLLLGQRLHLK